jgi:hypothetical protein
LAGGFFTLSYREKENIPSPKKTLAKYQNEPQSGAHQQLVQAVASFAELFAAFRARTFSTAFGVFPSRFAI